MSLPAAAQWPTFEAKRAPRAADGTVDLAAPAPKAADGHPDLSGLWERVGPGGANPEFDALQSPDGGPPAATFWNLGAGVRGGLPYTPLAALLRDERMADNQKNNPDALCLPMGLMQLHLHPQPRKIVQTPGLILIMYEGNEGLRQIFTDGRPLPTPGDELQPWWYGYSTGRWEGDTLVVETVGFRDDVWLDVLGSPLTSSGKMTERFRRLEFRHAADRRNHRRSNGLQAALHASRQPAVVPRCGAHRVHLQRKREVDPTLRPIEEKTPSPRSGSRRIM